MKIFKNKFSWGILTVLFTFDCVVSYIGVAKNHSRELNLVIAPYVEKYPLLYLVGIPIELLMVYVFVFVIRKFVFRFVIKHKLIDRTDQERVILESIAIYWFIANSSMNIIYVLGFRLPLNFALQLWAGLSLFAIVLVLLYIISITNS